MTRAQILFAATALAGALWSASAEAESVLTAHLEEQTSWVRNFNPFNITSRRASTLDFIYEPLVIYNSVEGGKPYYRLATSAKFSDDLLSLTYELRDGVQWSDGQPFTADDVKYTLDLMTKNAAVDFQGVGEWIASVEAPDPHRVVIKLKSVNAVFTEAMAEIPIVPKHVWEQVDDPAAFLNENPVGTGPLTEIRRFTEQVYEQCRNPHYWDAASLKVDCMRFPQIAGNDQILAIAAGGELDWFGSFLPDIENTFVKHDPDHFRYWQPGAETVYLMPNMEAKEPGNHEAFNDINFRRAFSMAMDRKSMVDIAAYGYPVANEHGSGIGPRFEDWRNKVADDKFAQYTRYDIEGAKKLLDEAGYKDTDGDGMRETPKGQKIDFQIIVPNGWTDWIDTCQIANEGLKAIGIKAEVSTPEMESWEKDIMEGSFDVGMHSDLDGPTPYKAYDDTFNSHNIGRNPATGHRYVNKDLDAALDAFRKTADPEKQKQELAVAQAIVAENLPIIPIYNAPTWYQYNTKRFTGWANAEKPFVNPEVHDAVHTRLLQLLALQPVQ